METLKEGQGESEACPKYWQLLVFVRFMEVKGAEEERGCHTLLDVILVVKLWLFAHQCGERKSPVGRVIVRAQ